MTSTKDTAVDTSAHPPAQQHEKEDTEKSSQMQDDLLEQEFRFASEDPELASPGSVSVSRQKAGRRKIDIEFIRDKSRRHITFSKRKAGIMKKAYELSTLTGTQVLLLVASETGHVYTFATPKLQPLIIKPEGKNLIQACLNSNQPPPLLHAGVKPPPPHQYPAYASGRQISRVDGGV